MKQTNILFFQRSCSPADGGVPRVTDIISKELTSRGYRCFYVYDSNENPLYADESKLKISLNDSYGVQEELILDFIIQNQINVLVCQNTYLPNYIKLFQKIRKLYPTHPFYTFLHASPDYWQSSFRTPNRKPSVKSLKEVAKTFLKKIIYPFYNPYISSTSALYQLSDKFVLLSDSFIDSFREIYSVIEKEHKLTSIPNPLTFANNISQAQLLGKEKIVLIVSRLEEEQKKISVALDIWKRISQQYDHGWKLLIVGSGPDENQYKKIVSDNKLTNVTFLGHQDDVRTYYERASIFLMTSIWEGLPMSLLEAQQNGVVPVVFDNFSAIYDVVTNAKNGFIIQQNDADAFRISLVNLMQDDSLRYKMASNSVQNSNRYHVVNIVNEWEEQLLKEMESDKALLNLDSINISK
ncbi:MAG: glycosyltransferase [Dyadobacter sp.]|uniref:glycosyltransferase n=1 Tax=Dyadobacter sp. TaxID=1914288 RepID=UPI003263507D